MALDVTRPFLHSGLTALHLSKPGRLLKRVPSQALWPALARPISFTPAFPAARAVAAFATLGAAGIAGTRVARAGPQARRYKRGFVVSQPVVVRCAAQSAELEYDCWETARVDPDADFDNVRMIFGYGSMCWRQGFPYTRAFPAFVHGFSRRFWQRSCDHRGTPEAPGRVLTLVQGGVDQVVHGVVFEIADADWPKVLANLDIRERHGYARTVVDVSVPSDGTAAKAIVYYAYHPEQSRSYVGPEDIPSTASVIATARGPSGRNDEYLFNLLAVLGDWGLPPDPYLTELANEVLKIQSDAGLRQLPDVNQQSRQAAQFVDS